MTSRYELGWWHELSSEAIGLQNWGCIVGKSKDDGMILICEHKKTHAQVTIKDDGTTEKDGTGPGMVCPPIGACKMLSQM